MKKNKQDYFNDCRTIQRITQHKRFVPYGTHPNPSLTLRTSFMLKTLYEIMAEERLVSYEENNTSPWRRK